MRKVFTILLLFTSLCVAQSFDWVWQNTQPQGNNLNDAQILSNGNYVAVGDHGTVLISTDAGTTWMVSYEDSIHGYRHIYEADFVDDNLAYAAGTDGLIMKTTDGGFNWTVMPTFALEDFWYVDFFDADTGMICGSNASVYKTTDGGNNWDPITLAAATGTIYKIHYVNASTVYIGTSSSTIGRLAKSTDYGESFNIVPAYTSTSLVRGIYFIDADTGYVTNSGYAVYKTTNGGTSFVEQGDFGTGSLYEVKFFDYANGVMAGANGEVYTTTNGGTNWLLKTNTYTSSNQYGMGLDGNLGETISDMLLVGEAGSISTSTDLGDTWNSYAASATMDELREIQFINENIGFAAGGSSTTADSLGTILKTTDGGATWNLLPYNTYIRNYSMYWVDENIGFVGNRGPNGIFKTTDGGASFITLNLGVGGSTDTWQDIAFANADTGYACGNNGLMIKTTDGGATWVELADGHGTSIIYSMFVWDANTFISTGASGKVYKSTDGGVTFQNLSNLGTTNAMYRVFFYDDNLGFIVGANHAYKTTNSGLSWTEMIVSAGTLTLTDVKFINPLKGWIGGWNGLLFYTNDGGNAWVTASRYPTINDIQKLAIAGPYIWTAGEYGCILKGYSDPLVPVELTAFTGKIIDGSVLLSWQTATETNNAGFDIERKNTNSDWESIGYVQGSGTSTEIHNYSFTDEMPANGVNFYRLKQIDYDGTIEYSQTVEVNFGLPLVFKLEQNYPNPFNPVTRIKYSIPQDVRPAKGGQAQDVRLIVYDVLGRSVMTLVNEQKEAGVYEVEFNASSLASGIYYYRLTAGAFVDVKKMVLLK